MKDTQVDIAISGVIADVTVRQVYQNHGHRPLHALYVFPASTRAAVYGMTMTTGNTRIVTTIKEREQAKQAFQAAKQAGKSASLLEESRPNVFTMNVANILPGDAISVELRYTELLVPDRWRLRIRLSDRRRSALLVEKRGRGIRRGYLREDALHTRRRSPEKRFPPFGRDYRRAYRFRSWCRPHIRSSRTRRSPGARTS